MDSSSPTTRKCCSRSPATVTPVSATSPRRSASPSGPHNGSSADLIEAGYVSRERVGRRNHYVVDPELKMRHPSQIDQDVGGLIELLQSQP